MPLRQTAHARSAEARGTKRTSEEDIHEESSLKNGIIPP